MPPAQKDGCRFDDSAWKTRVEETLWRSENSHSNQLALLKQRADAQQAFLKLWLPIIFGATTTGAFFVLQLIADRFLK